MIKYRGNDFNIFEQMEGIMRSQLSPTSVIFGPGQQEKLGKLSHSLGLNRSEVLRLLVDQAEVVSRPVVNVKIQNANTRGAMTLDGRAAGVEK
jgi:hypothetical protein